MKKLIFAACLLISASAYADRLGGLKSGANVLLTTQAASGINVYPATSTILSVPGTTAAVGYGFTGDPNTGLTSIVADTLQTVTAGAVSSSHTAAGEILQPLQPSFLVTNTAAQANVTGDGTIYDITFNNEIFDQGSDFASSTFTAPVTGRYFLTAQVFVESLTASVNYCGLYLKTSNRDYRNLIAHQVAYGEASYNVVAIADMDVGDIANVKVSCAGITKVLDIAGDARFVFFAGTLIN